MNFGKQMNAALGAMSSLFKANFPRDLKQALVETSTQVDSLTGDVETLQSELDRLRAEVNELRSKIEKE